MKKYVVITALICIAMISGLTACGAEASMPVDPAEYDALYDKYVRSIDIGMIFNSSWDDANDVRSDNYLYYYADSVLKDGGDFSDCKASDEYGLLIPAETLEAFVQSHFDVTTEHLRTNEYYVAEENAYGFGGLGSAWHCEIIGAEQEDKLLTIQYDVIGAMDYVVGRGVLAIEVNGENYIYLSNGYEQSAQSYLEYPNVISTITDQNNVLAMDSGRGTTTGNPKLNIREYSGKNLSDIIYYYENVALPALEAQGGADPGKYEDGWYWSGTYRGGKTLTIDVRRKFGGETYIIAAAYEENADIEAARAAVNAIKLDDLDRLYIDYLQKPFYAGLLDSYWTVPFNVQDMGAYVRMYALVEGKDTESELRFPTSDVDIFLEHYFEESDLNMIRYSIWYDEATDTYFSDTGFAEGTQARVTQAKLDGDKLILSYEVYEPEHEEDGIYLWEGELTIVLSEKGYKYASNIKRYPFYPISQDAAYLDEITDKYITPMMPAYGILWKSWASPMDIPADDLVNFCAFNNLLNLPPDLDLGEGFADNHGPASDVESAIKRYFDVSVDYLRTSRYYGFINKDNGERYDNEYIMVYGFGGGGQTCALHAEQDGDLLKITVGLYGPDDEIPDRPVKTGLLTIQLDEDGYQYLSYELA